jgi:hypothetical protein
MWNYWEVLFNLNTNSVAKSDTFKCNTFEEVLQYNNWDQNDFIITKKGESVVVVNPPTATCYSCISYNELMNRNVWLYKNRPSNTYMIILNNDQQYYIGDDNMV